MRDVSSAARKPYRFKMRQGPIPSSDDTAAIQPSGDIGYEDFGASECIAGPIMRNEGTLCGYESSSWAVEELDRLDTAIIQVAEARSSERARRGGSDAVFSFDFFVAISNVVRTKSPVKCFIYVANAFQKALSERHGMLSTASPVGEARSSELAAQAYGRQHSLQWLDSETFKLKSALAALGFPPRDGNGRILDADAFSSIVVRVGTRSSRVVRFWLNQLCWLNRRLQLTFFRRFRDMYTFQGGCAMPRTCPTGFGAEVSAPIACIDLTSKVAAHQEEVTKMYLEVDAVRAMGESVQGSSVYNWMVDELDRLDGALLKIASRRLVESTLSTFDVELSHVDFVELSNVVETRDASQWLSRVNYSHQWGIALEKAAAASTVRPQHVAESFSRVTRDRPRQYSMDWLPGEVARFEAGRRRMSKGCLTEQASNFDQFVGTRSPKLVRFQPEKVDRWDVRHGEYLRYCSEAENISASCAAGEASGFKLGKRPWCKLQESTSCGMQVRRRPWLADELNRLDAGILSIAEKRIEQATTTNFGAILHFADCIAVSQVVQTRSPAQCLARIYTCRQMGVLWEKENFLPNTSPKLMSSREAPMSGAPGCARQHSLDWLPGEVARLEEALRKVSEEAYENTTDIEQIAQFVGTRSVPMVRFHLVVFHGWDADVFSKVSVGNSGLGPDGGVAARSYPHSDPLAESESRTSSLVAWDASRNPIRRFSDVEQPQICGATEIQVAGNQADLKQFARLIATSRSTERVYKKLHFKRYRENWLPTCQDINNGPDSHVAGPVQACYIGSSESDERPVKRRHAEVVRNGESLATSKGFHAMPEASHSEIEGCLLAGDGKHQMAVCLYANCTLPTFQHELRDTAWMQAREHSSGREHLRCVHQDSPIGVVVPGSATYAACLRQK